MHIWNSFLTIYNSTMLWCKNDPTVSTLCCSCGWATKCGLVWFPSQISQYLRIYWSICHEIYITRKLWLRKIHVCINYLHVTPAAATMYNTNSISATIERSAHGTWPDDIIASPLSVVYYQVQIFNLYPMVLCIFLLNNPRRGYAIINAVLQLMFVIAPYMGIWSGDELT